jgi:tRNA pseudouridine55 synthase
MIPSVEETAVHPSEQVDEGLFLLIDKPLQWTSFDVIHKIRRCLGVAKAGHAGTLDPRATGLLIVCTGRQTKRLQDFTGLEKEYTGSFQLGIRTPSFDLETAVSETVDFSSVTRETLESTAQTFVGKQLQLPPMYSAVKHHGKPLYKFARKGKTLERAPKEIDIMEFSILSFEPPRVTFRVRCSKGTYIRALANDMGNILGCGATLADLRRTRIGEFSVEEALTISQLEAMKDMRGPAGDEEHESSTPA